MAEFSHTSGVQHQELLSHMGFVKALARALVGDPERADDLAQETMLAALEARSGPKGSARGWLVGVVRRLSLMQYRGNERRQRHTNVYAERTGDELDSGGLVETAVLRAEIRGELVDGVMGLSDPYRIAIVLRYMEDMTPREIAEALSMPVDTVKTHLQRGLALLRAHFKEVHKGDRLEWRASLVGLSTASLGGDLLARSAAAAQVPVVSHNSASLLMAGKVVAAAVVVAVLVTSAYTLLFPDEPIEQSNVSERTARLVKSVPPQGPPPPLGSQGYKAPANERIVEVVDEEGRPIVGARVVAFAAKRQEGRTNQSGHAVLHSPPGTWVRAQHKDYTPTASVLTKGDGARKRLTLRRGALYRICVREERTGRPVTRATAKWFPALYGRSRRVDASISENQPASRAGDLPPQIGALSSMPVAMDDMLGSANHVLNVLHCGDPWDELQQESDKGGLITVRLDFDCFTGIRIEAPGFVEEEVDLDAFSDGKAAVVYLSPATPVLLVRGPLCPSGDLLVRAYTGGSKSLSQSVSMAVRFPSGQKSMVDNQLPSGPIVVTARAAGATAGCTFIGQFESCVGAENRIVLYPSRSVRVRGVWGGGANSPLYCMKLTPVGQYGGIFGAKDSIVPQTASAWDLGYVAPGEYELWGEMTQGRSVSRRVNIPNSIREMEVEVFPNPGRLRVNAYGFVGKPIVTLEKVGRALWHSHHWFQTSSFDNLELGEYQLIVTDGQNVIRKRVAITGLLDEVDIRLWEEVTHRLTIRAVRPNGEPVRVLVAVGGSCVALSESQSWSDTWELQISPGEHLIEYCSSDSMARLRVEVNGDHEERRVILPAKPITLRVLDSNGDALPLTKLMFKFGEDELHLRPPTRRRLVSDAKGLASGLFVPGSYLLRTNDGRQGALVIGQSSAYEVVLERPQPAPQQVGSAGSGR